MHKAVARSLPLSLALIGACGSGAGSVDAGSGDDGFRPDSNFSGMCAEFAAPAARIDAYPARVTGSLAGAGADLVADPGDCSVEIAPFGVSSPGADGVIALTELFAGATYQVRVFGAGDLAYYVATDCSPDASAPVAGACLLFVDATSSFAELGEFVAPEGGTAYLVIDHWRAEGPSAPDYSVEVFASECDSANNCAAPLVCVDRRCVDCANDYYCAAPSSPLCDIDTNMCVAGVGNCSTDDQAENADDGPAGATPATPDGSGLAQRSGYICNDPLGEYDYFSFDVTTPGEQYTITLDWDVPTADLELTVTNAGGELVGLSLWSQPEQIELAYLPVGRYYVIVDQFGGESVASIAYSLQLSRIVGQTCTGVADCASEYDTQLFRGRCSSGACESITTGGGLLDSLCDSHGDCASNWCSAAAFTADADDRSRCTHACITTAECADLGPDWVCTDYLEVNLCVPKCQSSEQCPIEISVPPDSGSWTHRTCDLATGRCRSG